MPTSRPNHLHLLCESIIRSRPKSILDIGIGFGSKGMLFREYTDVWNGDYFSWKTKIDGVEIYEKYITDLQKSIYDNIYIGDIREVVDKISKYDLIYMGDVIEHMDKEDGIELVKKLIPLGKSIIIVTPIKVSEQGSIYENENERHISEWSVEDFNDLGFRVTSVGNMFWAVKQMSVYYCQPMSFYGERLRDMFGLFSYSPFNKTIFVGLYFEGDYKLLEKHEGGAIIFWNGSDVARLLKTPELQKIVHKSQATHVCHNEQLQSELASIGIDAIIRPLFFADLDDYKECYKPGKEVYINAHPLREVEYGVDKMLEAAKQLPDYKFNVYGIEGKAFENVVYHGRISEGEADKKMSKHQIFLRLNSHDGLSQQMIKAGYWGQHILSAKELPGTVGVESVEDITKAIREVGINPNKKFREHYSLILNRLDWF